MRDDRHTRSLHEGIAVNRTDPLVLRSLAGIALQHLATHKRLLRLLEMRRGECGSHRESRRQEIPPDAAAECIPFPKPEPGGR